MKYIFSFWEQLKPLFLDSHISLFLDYDGTLTPIVARPEKAELDIKTRKLLKTLSAQNWVKLGIVSGRALSDLKKRVSLSGIIYAGNHGLELEGPAIAHVHPDAEKFSQLLKKICHRLQNAYRAFPDILIEMKTFGISVHYRQLPEKKIKITQAILTTVLSSYLNKDQIVLTEGKKVWEIRPPVRWNKGHTVLWLFGRALASAKCRTLPIYIGDDVTDEDAFRALKKRGIAIKVTKSTSESSSAEYFLQSPGEVYQFLNRLIRLKTQKIK